VGDAVNLASRMESLAEPGTTYVTVETFKLTEGLFRFEASGERDVKGKEEPVKVYRVIAIERLNKEFKRRTKPMEILAGENACYTLLAFICLKIELHWRSNPIRKVRGNLSFLKELAEKNFTQKT